MFGDLTDLVGGLVAQLGSNKNLRDALYRLGRASGAAILAQAGRAARAEPTPPPKAVATLMPLLQPVLDGVSDEVRSNIQSGVVGLSLAGVGALAASFVVGRLSKSC